MPKRVVGLLLGVFLTINAGAFAAVPQEMGYQGYLTNAAGVPVTGNITISFSLYTAATGGTPLWTENQTIGVDKGIYSVSLGAVTPITLPFDTRYYLGIRVGNDVAELSPRQALASTPYAYRAKGVEALDAGSVTDATISGTISGNKLGSHSHSGSDISSGTLPSARLSGIYSQALGLTNVGNVFIGNGAGLTSLDAANLAAGTLPSARLSGTYSQALSLTNTGNVFTGNGAGLTSLDATKLSSGTIPDARLAANVQRKYGKVAIVAQSGGDYTNPVTAMSGVGTWCGTPSATNPCLLKIMPGVYDIGGSTVMMQRYVDLEGSGENVTTITGAVSSASAPLANGVVKGESDAEIRLLTVKNTGPGEHVTAIMSSSASPKMTGVTVSATGGTNNYGVYNNYYASPTMINVTASASGAGNNYGVYNNSSSPTMNHVIASASGGTNYGVFNYRFGYNIMTDVYASATGGTTNNSIYNSNASPIMTNVVASASGGSDGNYGVYNDDGSSPRMSSTSVSASGASSYGVFNYYSSSPIMNNVTINITATALKSWGVFNSTSSSPVMNHVTINASGGTDSCGVYNYYNSSPIMNHVTASASGTTSSFGVKNTGGSVIMNNVTASASGTGGNYAVYNSSASPSMNNVTASTKNGTSNYGMYNEAGSGAYTLIIDRSTFEGSTRSILNDTEFTLRIGASKLTGGAVNAVGTYNCVGVYDGDTYTALNAACQ